MHNLPQYLARNAPAVTTHVLAIWSSYKPHNQEVNTLSQHISSNVKRQTDKFYYYSIICYTTQYVQTVITIIPSIL